MDSAISLSSWKLSINHCLIFKASLAEEVLITGALVIISEITWAFTPPDDVIVDAPLLIDATSAPSDVANGT